MLLITQGSASQQLNRFWSEVQTALTYAHALAIDEGQQEGHPESVTVTEAAGKVLLIRTGDPKQPTGGGGTAYDQLTS